MSKTEEVKTDGIRRSSEKPNFNPKEAVETLKEGFSKEENKIPTLEELSQDSQDLIKSLQQLSRVSSLLDSGTFPGQAAQFILDAKSYLKQLHFQGLEVLSKDELAMKFPGVKEAWEEAQKNMGVSK